MANGEMREKLRDVRRLQGVLQAKLLRAMCAAAAKVSRAARGHRVFESDWDERACFALLKLAGAMVGEVPEMRYGTMDDPDWWTDERKEAWEEYKRISDENDRREANGETLEIDD